MCRMSLWYSLLLAVFAALSGCTDYSLPRRAVEAASDTVPEAVSRANPPDNRRAPASGSEAASFAQLRKGLRRLVAAQETFFAENGAYTGDIAVIGFRPEPGTDIRFLWATQDGWAASGTHTDLPGRDCVVFIGQVHAPPTTLKYVRQGRAGVPVCDDSPRPARPVAARPLPEAEPPEALPDTTSALETLNPRTLMKADLHNLVRSQKTHFANQGVYALRTEPLALQFLWRPGVRVNILSADAQSWAARATHPRLPGKSCVIWFGAVDQRPVTDAQRRQSRAAGVPVCDE